MMRFLISVLLTGFLAFAFGLFIALVEYCTGIFYCGDDYSSITGKIFFGRVLCIIYFMGKPGLVD